MASVETVLTTIYEVLVELKDDYRKIDGRLDSIESEISGLRVALVESHDDLEKRHEKFREEITRVEGRCRDAERRIRLVEAKEA
jgi:chromosome segregation ATPase